MELRFPPCASAQSPWLPSGTVSTPSWPLTCFPAMPPADLNPSRGGAEPRGPQARTCITPPWAPGPGTPLSQPSLGPSLGTLGNMHQPMDQDPGHCGLAVHAGHWGLVRWPHVSMVDRLVSSLLPMMEDSEGQAGGVVWAQSGRLCLVQHQVPWLGALGLMAPGPHTRLRLVAIQEVGWMLGGQRPSVLPATPPEAWDPAGAGCSVPCMQKAFPWPSAHASLFLLPHPASGRPQPLSVLTCLV